MEELIKKLNSYVEDRDAAIIESIRTDSVEPFKAFLEKHKELVAYPECFNLPSDEAIEITIRKMSLHCVKIPPEIKGRSVEWLLSRGYDLNLK